MKTKFTLLKESMRHCAQRGHVFDVCTLFSKALTIGKEFGAIPCGCFTGHGAHSEARCEPWKGGDAFGLDPFSKAGQLRRLSRQNHILKEQRLHVARAKGDGRLDHLHQRQKSFKARMQMRLEEQLDTCKAVDAHIRKDATRGSGFQRGTATRPTFVRLAHPSR